MSAPPHRDLPIEWRTGSGDVIGGPASTGEDPPSSYLSAEDLLEPDADEQEYRWAVRLRIAAIAVVAAALGITAAAGGLAPAPSRTTDLPLVAVGETVDTGPFRITVERAAVFTTLGSTEPTDPGGSLLAVMATVEVTADRTRPLLGIDGNAVVAPTDLPGLVEAQPRRIMLARDGESAFWLHPALPERVVFIWDLAPGATIPTEVELDLHGATYRRTNFIFLNEWRWWDDGPRARAVVPVEDRREAA